MKYIETEEREKLDKVNEKLIHTMKINSKKILLLTAIGNSISNGFSFSEPGKLLLDRNDSLIDEGKKAQLDIQFYHLTRSENNNSLAIYNWIRNNCTEQDCYDWNRADYKRLASEGTVLLDDDMIDQYFTDGNKEGIRSILSDNGKETANIIVLNAGTGSFLDNITRHGKINIPSIHYSLKRDMIGISEILEFVLNNNRNNNTLTQVYLCGAPRLMNTAATDLLMNPAMKKIATEYPNVTYVPSFSKEVYYRDKNGKIIFDLHYNNAEYLHFLSLIEQSIIDNYSKKELMINMDRELYRMSVENDIESGNNSRDDVLNVVNNCALDYSSGEVNMSDYKCFLKMAKKYIEQRYPYDFYRAATSENIGKELKKKYKA